MSKDLLTFITTCDRVTRVNELITNLMKYTKIAFFAVALVFVVSAPTFVFALTASGNGSTAGSVIVPATVDNNIGGSVVTVPPTQNNGSTAGNTTVPATQTNGSTAGSATVPPTQDNGSTAGTGLGGSVVTVPPTQDNGSTAGTGTVPPTQDNGSTAGTGSNGGNTGGNNNGNGSGPVGSVSSGGSSSSSGSYVGLPALTNIGQCQYITSFMKFGAANNSAEVTKLQTFLKNTEGMNVAVTGTFDIQTLRAVEAFQAKYVVDVMHPWGASIPSGYVYLTTSKKINEIFCKKNFSLTPAQLAEIQAYRTRVQSGSTPVSNNEIGINSTPTVSPSTQVAVSGTSTSTGTSSDSQVAAAGKTPFFSKIWNFVKRIFGR